MARPKKGVLQWKRDRIDALAEELRQWMIDNPDEWQIEKFSTGKMIPYKYFTDVFPVKSSLFAEVMSLCEDFKRVRFIKAVEEKRIPPTFGIFASKNELGYRDRIASEDKKGAKKEQPTKQAVKDAIAKAKENSFSKPD